MNIGFIGIGNMGVHMARHVLEAGFALYVNDLTIEAARPLLERGAQWADTPAKITEQCRVVLSCLPREDVAELIAAGFCAKGGVPTLAYDGRLVCSRQE